MTVALQSLVLIAGEEPYLVDREAARWLSAARAVCGDIEMFDSPGKLGPVAGAVCDTPMFAEARGILIRDAPQFSSKSKKGADSPDELAKLVANRAPTTWLALVVHGAVGSNHPVSLAVKQNGGAIIGCEQIKRDELRSWISREAADRNLKLPYQTIEELAAVTDGSLGVIAHELDKFSSYAATEKLDERAASALVSGSETTKIWSVVEGLLSERPALGMAALDDLLVSGTSPQFLMVTIAGQIRDLVVAQSVLKTVGGGQSTLERELRLPGWKARRVMQQLNAVGKRDPSEWLIQLAELDAATKTGNATDVEGLRLFAAKLAVKN